MHASTMLTSTFNLLSPTQEDPKILLSEINSPFKDLLISSEIEYQGKLESENLHLFIITVDLPVFEKKISSVEAKNASLTQQNGSLTEQNASLTEQNASLTEQNASLMEKNASLEATNASLVDQNDSKAKCIGKSLIDEEKLQGEVKKFQELYEKSKEEFRKLKCQNKNTKKLDEIFSEPQYERLELITQNMGLLEENRVLRIDLEKNFKESLKLRKALVAAYDLYGGLTSRVTLDKFYQFFMKGHEILNCPHHSSLYSDPEKRYIDKREASEHWKTCTLLSPHKKNILTKFNVEIWNLNSILNTYIHRDHILEVIIPSNIDDYILKEIYNLEKNSFEKDVNENPSEPLEFVKINRNVNEEIMVKNFYLYKLQA